MNEVNEKPPKTAESSGRAGRPVWAKPKITYAKRTAFGPHGLPYTANWEGIGNFNTDWDQTFRHDLKVLDELDHRRLPAKGFPCSTLIIVDGEIYLGDQYYLTLRWAKYLRKILFQWHPDPPISAFIIFRFTDKSIDLSVQNAAFYPSKIRNGTAPLWMDWDHLQRLLDLEKPTEPRNINEAGRHQKPMWRGSFDCDTIAKEADQSGQDFVQVMRGKKRLALVNFSQKYPQLLDAKLSKLSPNELVRPWWRNDNVLTERQWFDYDEIPADQYYTRFQNVIVVDGIGAAFRLLDHFRNAQTVLFQDSDYLQYYYRYLEPWVQFVPLLADLSDAREKLEWVIGNPEKSLEIARNGRRFFDRYLSWEPSMDLSRKILLKLTAVQREVDHRGIVSELQMEKLDNALN